MADEIPADRKLELIRKRNVENLIRRLNSGAVLTPAQHKEVKDYYATQPGGGREQGAGNTKQPSSYASMAQAAAALHLPLDRLKWAKRQGCPAFRANRVYRTELIDWLAAHGSEYAAARQLGGIELKKEEEVGERVRKLKLRNDHEEGLLLKRSWIVERTARAAGELNALWARWESEWPLLFAQTGGDVVKCRTIVRAMRDEAMRGMHALKHHFEEGSDRKSA